MKQYYYKNDKCPVELASMPGCICWHDIGTGPFPKGTITQREKPVLSAAEHHLPIIVDAAMQEGAGPKLRAAIDAYLASK